MNHQEEGQGQDHHKDDIVNVIVLEIAIVTVGHIIRTIGEIQMTRQVNFEGMNFIIIIIASLPKNYLWKNIKLSKLGTMLKRTIKIFFSLFCKILFAFLPENLPLAIFFFFADNVKESKLTVQCQNVCNLAA